MLVAIQIIHVDVRPETRTTHNPGYRQRVTMIRFFWAAPSTQQRLNQLSGQDRGHGERALSLLRLLTTSSYKVFENELHRFLLRRENATLSQRRRQLQFIESVRLACALCRNLLWHTEWPRTHERAFDARHWKLSTVENLLHGLSDDDGGVPN